MYGCKSPNRRRKQKGQKNFLHGTRGMHFPGGAQDAAPTLRLQKLSIADPTLVHGLLTKTCPWGVLWHQHLSHRTEGGQPTLFLHISHHVTHNPPPSGMNTTPSPQAQALKTSLHNFEGKTGSHYTDKLPPPNKLTLLPWHCCCHYHHNQAPVTIHALGQALTTDIWGS